MDLKGGTHLVYEAQPKEGEKIKARSFVDENSKWRHEQIEKYERINMKNKSCSAEILVHVRGRQLHV